MRTVTIALPDTLKDFVDAQVQGRGYGDPSSYLQDLIRQDRDRQHLRTLLLEGASSPLTAPADTGYFDELRARARRHDVA